MWRKIIQNPDAKTHIGKSELKAIVWTIAAIIAVMKGGQAWYNNGCDVTAGITERAANNIGVDKELLNEAQKICDVK